jgi:hypothetical protein
MFFGGKELILFEGVVEDRNDPLFLGRVRVRAIGFHDPDKQKMPIDTLPWATPLLPADDGRNVVGYKEGDFVAGYFRDGESKQYPVILGKIPGIPENPSNPEIGYNDPTPDEDLIPGKVARPPEMIPPPTSEEANGENVQPTGKYDNPNKLPAQLTSTGQLKVEFGDKPFPYDVNGDGKYDASDASLLIDPDQDGIIGAEENEGDLFGGSGGEVEQVPISRYPLESQLKESIASRLARNEKIEQTLVARKKGSIITAPTATHAAMGVGTDQANEGEAMGEPETPYDAKYPYNHVYESESGHVIEYDDTPLVERLHTYHRSGTFREIHPDGKQVDKVVNDRYDLALGDANYQSEKNVKITAKENLRAHASKAMVLESGADMAQDSGGDRNVFVGKNANTRIKENVYTVIDGDVRILIKGTLNVAVEGDIKIKAKGDILTDGLNIVTTATGLNTLKAGIAVVTEGPLTYTNTLLTDGTLIRARYSDTSAVAGGISTIIPIPSATQPPPFIKENDADNKDNLVTSSTPKEGYILNDDSVIRGTKLAQDLYKPQSDSDGKAVVLSLRIGQQAKLYEALPTGELQDAKLQYKHKDGRIVEWNVRRPVHKKGRFIEAGRYSGNGNGGREHWRFKKSGGGYPSIMILQIGDVEYLIVESITRHEAF